MSTLASNYYGIVSQLPAETVVTFRNVSWEEYEDLLEQVGDARHLRISYNDGTLQVLTLSAGHEMYARFFEKLMTILSLRLRVSILSFGSATMRRQNRRKGNEPDACFYVQNAAAIGNRSDLDFTQSTRPPTLPSKSMSITILSTSCRSMQDSASRKSGALTAKR